jgi:peptide/nickel transport system permease protein
MLTNVKRYFRNTIAWVSIAIFAFFLFTAIFAPLISPHLPNDQDLTKRLLPPAWSEGGNRAYLFGTDELGRDILSRVIYGSQVSISVGVLAALLSGAFGTLIGLFSGYYSKVDDAMMRLADIQLAFPTILLALVVVAVVGGGFGNLVLILGITGWVYYARIIRSEVLSIKQSEYIIAAKTLGIGDQRILFVHILPNIIAPAVTIATFQVASAIITESTLSFLGLGIPVNIPSWGNMLHQGQLYIESAWWLTVFPGICIMLVVLSINLLGDVLTDYMNPKTRQG